MFRPNIFHTYAAGSTVCFAREDGQRSRGAASPAEGRLLLETSYSYNGNNLDLVH